MLKNDKDAQDFYELCHLASTPSKNHLSLLVGSNSKCRESYLADLSVTDEPKDVVSEFVGLLSPDDPLPILKKDPQAQFYKDV